MSILPTHIVKDTVVNIATVKHFAFFGLNSVFLLSVQDLVFSPASETTVVILRLN